MPPPDLSSVEAELSDFSVFGLANTAEELARVSQVLNDAQAVLAGLTAPADGATADAVNEKLAAYRKKAEEAGLDLSAISSAVGNQHDAIGDYNATAPTDEEIAQAQAAVDKARAALADGTGTQEDLDAAVAHLNDLLDRKKAAENKLGLDTLDNSGVVDDPASANPKKNSGAPSSGSGMPQGGQPQGGQPTGQQGGQPGAQPNHTPMTNSDLENLLGRRSGLPDPTSMTGLMPGDISTIPAFSSAPPDRGSSLSGIPTAENITGKTKPASPFPTAGATKMPVGAPGGGGMGGGGMMPMGGMGAPGGAGGKSDKERPKVIDADDDMNNPESTKYAADGGVINPTWGR